MQEFDPRIIKVSIEVDGVIKTYEGLNIVASGTKYANANQNTCEIKISNLTKETRDYILTKTSPLNLNRTPKKITLEAGRQSYGTSVIFRGNITNSNPSQPPDITLTLKCMTGYFLSGNIISSNQTSSARLSQVSEKIAKDLDMPLNFQATDINIGNYTHSGASTKQVDKLNDMGNINAYIDDDTLIVKDSDLPLSNVITIVNAETGMIGIPELTEQGIKVSFLLDNRTKLGGTVRVKSKINPAANGDYIIYKLNFEVASRDVPFYYIAEARRRF